jgi:hypothetical protein
MLFRFWTVGVDSWTGSSASTLSDRNVAIGGPRWIPLMLDSGEWYMPDLLGEGFCWCSVGPCLDLFFGFTSNRRFSFSSSNIRVSCWLSLGLDLTSAMHMSNSLESHLFRSSITSWARLEGLWAKSTDGALSVSNEQVIFSFWHRMHGNCKSGWSDDGKHRCFRARHYFKILTSVSLLDLQHSLVDKPE